MEEHEMILLNTCADLVGLRKNEVFPRRLLDGKRPGEWVRVVEFCSQVGLTTQDMKADLFVAWLPDPAANEEYVVIMFYDDESKWSMAAHYNRGRRARKPLLDATTQPTGAPLAPSAEIAAQREVAL
jgi:hypothetical protein